MQMMKMDVFGESCGLWVKAVLELVG